MKLTAIYVRVSTTGQNEAGQRGEITRWLIGNGIDPATVAWYSDQQTGDNLERPGFAKLQADIFAGKVGTVVVWRLDRLSRKLRDGLDVLCDWTDRGIRVVSVTQQIDLSGSVGRMIAAVLLGIGEMEQETRRERQAAGIAAAKTRGAYQGRKAGTTKATPAQVAEMRSRGMAVPEIAKVLGVTRQSVYRYLRTA
ncbi:MAG: recombinase family protein [Pirellulaceae bacterium]